MPLPVPAARPHDRYIAWASNFIQQGASFPIAVAYVNFLTEVEGGRPAVYGAAYTRLAEISKPPRTGWRPRATSTWRT